MPNQTKTRCGQKAGSVPKREKGFTLIELLVVISIMGLLASVVAVSLANARVKSRDAKRLADIKQFSTALEMYYNTYNSYPTTTGVAANTYGALKSTSAACVSGTAGCVNNLAPKFLSQIPVAPVPADSAVCAGAYGGSGQVANDYQFAGTGNTGTINYYTITFCLGRDTGEYDAGIHTLTPKGIQ